MCESRGCEVFRTVIESHFQVTEVVNCSCGSLGDIDVAAISDNALF